MNNSDVDMAKENGNEVMPRTRTLRICGVSSTEIHIEEWLNLDYFDKFNFKVSPMRSKTLDKQL